MNSTMERVSSNKVKFRMELAADAFEAALQAAYLKMRGRINVPGFRKGRAPRKMIERMYGESIFYEEAFDAVFPGMYDEAVTAHDAQVIDRPEVDIETISAAEGLVVVAEVYVQPEITLGQYKGLAVEREDDTIDDEAVEQELGRLRQRNARETEIEDRPVQDDDIVTLDYAGTVDGVPFEGGTAEGQTLTIGSGQFIQGFEEQMIGMQIGEERDLQVKFPEEYHSEELSGKDAVFHVKVLGIRTRELPELDDEFAKDVSEFDTLEEYRADIRANLAKTAAERAEAAFENALVQAALDNAELDVPPPMIDQEVESELRSMDMRLRQQGISLENYIAFTGQSMDDLREQRREGAETRVKGELVIEAIRKAEGIVATEADIEAMTAKIVPEGIELTDAHREYIADVAAKQATLDFLKREAAPAQ
ncbi:MAG: trigger factor [Oscillospiraceae bacterium]|jgi:trigger factor|nr:trigger factor [Oscillospiraceae bacterium]